MLFPKHFSFCFYVQANQWYWQKKRPKHFVEQGIVKNSLHLVKERNWIHDETLYHQRTSVGNHRSVCNHLTDVVDVPTTQTRKEGNVLFNDALNTFYLRLYGVRHVVKDHSDSERGNPLPRTTAFATPVVEHWLEWETAQWVHHEASIRRSIAPWANALTTELHLAPNTDKHTSWNVSTTRERVQ